MTQQEAETILPEITDLTEAETAAVKALTAAIPERSKSEQDSGTGSARGRGKPKADSSSSKTPSGPPSADDWADFLGGVVLRLITEAYLYLVLFRHIEESDLTDRELATVKMTKEELKDIAKPMGTVVSKQKLARKHGRTVIATAESYESVLDLLFWMRRVNKVARHHKKMRFKDENTTEGVVLDEQVPGTNGSAGPEPAANEKPTGHGGFGIFNPGHHG